MAAVDNLRVLAVSREAGPDAEARWIEAARAGDRRAFGRIYERYVALVHGIVLSRVPGPDVPDVVQDVFTVALDRLSTFAPGAAFGPWIAAIARNRATDVLRTRRSNVPWDEALRATRQHSPESIEALRQILELPEAYRETMVLRLVEGLRGPEIAERTGLTPGSVRVNLHRGMKLLRARLRGEGTSR